MICIVHIDGMNSRNKNRLKLNLLMNFRDIIVCGGSLLTTTLCLNNLFVEVVDRCGTHRLRANMCKRKRNACRWK